MVRRAVPGRLPEMAESSPGSLGVGRAVPPPDCREVGRGGRVQWSVMIVVGYFTTMTYSFITTFAQKMTIHKALTRPHPLREIAEPGQPGSCPVHTPLRPIAEPGELSAI